MRRLADGRMRPSGARHMCRAQGPHMCGPANRRTLGDTPRAVSNENVELARDALAAYNREGIEGILRYLDPEVEWRNPADSPIAGVWFGHEGVLEWQRLTDEAFDELHFEPKHVEALPGERVLAISDCRLRGSGSSIEVAFPFAHLISFRDGKVTEVRMYTQEAEARAAAGSAGQT